MPKGRYGILGQPVKKQTLFSFQARPGEEWPSDDSSDEDFMPEDDEDVSTTKKQKTSKRRSKTAEEASPKKPRLTHNDEGTVSKVSDGVDRWGHGLPPELLMRIFTCVVDTEGAVPFLIRAGKVNTFWNAVSKEESLWTSVDLSYGWIKSTTATVNWLCSNRLAKVQHLNLSSWKKLKLAEVEILCRHCPLLESLNLSHCPKIMAPAVKIIADSFPKLHTIDLSATTTDALCYKSLSYLLKTLGSRLKSLSIASNTVTGFSFATSDIYKYCPNLELLDISNCKLQMNALVIEIEKFQMGCPKLRILRMANCYITSSISSKGESNGFPCLEEVSLAFSPDKNLRSGVDDRFVNRMLKNSPLLRLLDLRGCVSVRAQCVMDLAVEELQELYVSHTHMSKNSDTELKDIISKWVLSLRVLDISWMPLHQTTLAAAMEALGNCAPKTPAMENLVLSGTNVTVTGIKHVLSGCPRLRQLSLVSCRGLPRGIKREYKEKDLTQLKKTVRNMNDAD